MPMARKIEVCCCWMIFVSFISLNVQNLSQGTPVVPCYFIFGDSLVDSGNNNNLKTDAKVNYWPYGIDFPEGPTGRFCNGRTTADIITERLGFTHYIPAFASANGSEILEGVNYASGSAGILDETGSHQGICVSLKKQLEHHNITVSRIADMLGSYDLAHEHLNKCLYTVNIGSNDYINNYFLPQFYNSSKQYTTDQYAKHLIKQYHYHLQNLYQHGARKVALTGLGPVGCTPNATSYYGTNGSLCVDKMNYAVQLFNYRLISLVDKLNNNVRDAKFIAVNTKITTVPGLAIGFNMSLLRCCEVNGFGLCIPSKSPCRHRNLRIFFDSFHPTEVVNTIQASRAFQALVPSDTYPMDIRHLALL
ncbi:GDSL esterase/lipase [Melia azedarach]|uniref:GDSL esterase/lipase n=1 Tax=Melia azedarach TaxID=155640 RepID=A0ACC1WZG8_MELAZ|nr:GDSL esterase/lipase [Melia azedarach]